MDAGDPGAGGPRPALRVHALTKRFRDVLANDAISLDVLQGEVHALLGENGAGKSTLVKCIYGFYQRDAGELVVDDEPQDFRSPHDARAHGIGMVFQDLTLIPALSVVENVALFLPDLPRVPDLKAIAKELDALGERYSLKVDPWALVRDLSIGQQQKAELLKLLMARCRVLILDEPTRVLAPHEIQGFFEVLKRLVEDGLAVILITHKLAEVLEIADRVTILRQGRVAGQVTRAAATEAGLLRLMFDKELARSPAARQAVQVGGGPPALELIEASTRGEGAEVSLEQIDLVVHPERSSAWPVSPGTARRSWARSILGSIACVSGTKRLFGRPSTHESISAVRRSGVSYIPENPLAMAAIPYLTVLENMAVTRTSSYARRGGLSMDWDAAEADADRSWQRLGFEVPTYVPARSLSGGNLQRMVIARELLHDPRLIIASYLTRGLDVQSAQAARDALLQARSRGAGVLLISEDLEELFEYSDRLVVMYGGRIVGVFLPADTDIYEVGRLMTGSHVSAVAS